MFSSRAEHQVDLQRKLQEDPLMDIRKTELDTRKKVLDNPLRMKQLKEYVSDKNALEPRKAQFLRFLSFQMKCIKEQPIKD